MKRLTLLALVFLSFGFAGPRPAGEITWNRNDLEILASRNQLWSVMFQLNGYREQSLYYAGRADALYELLQAQPDPSSPYPSSP